MEKIFPGFHKNEKHPQDPNEELITLDQKIGELSGLLKSYYHNTLPNIERPHSESSTELNPGSSITSTFDPEKAETDLKKHKERVLELIEKCDEEEKLGKSGTPDLEVKLRALLREIEQDESLFDELRKKGTQENA